jgi:trans-L-3-hydroxyproline dehydratase
MASAFDHLNWTPPAHWTRISTLDMHTGGEPLRVITSGLPPIEGRTVLEKRRYFREHYDHLRTGLMWEPRGHADMYGAVVTDSETADLDVFFLHNEGYSTMCGHAIIALTKLAVETGRIRSSNGEAHLTINVPAGTVHARASISEGKVVTSSFRNVPSFAYLRDRSVEVPGIGSVRFDVSYGGAFYAIVDAEPLGLDLSEREYNRIIDWGRRIKTAVMAQFPIEHPVERDLSFLYGTIFTAPAADPRNHSRNVTVFAEGEVDRSATGSGVSARAALHHARGELDAQQEITIESILGSTMSVRVVDTLKFGPYDAVVPEVSGMACYTGRHEFWFDPADPLRQGFIFR